MTGFGDALRRMEPGPDGRTDYVVRTVPGARATKVYRCPGCDHEIRPGVAHLVAWPADGLGAEDRRHWHTGCWSGRATRGLTRRWS
jgi:hypothetical protein